jgi:neutral ceramidase
VRKKIKNSVFLVLNSVLLRVKKFDLYKIIDMKNRPAILLLILIIVFLPQFLSGQNTSNTVKMGTSQVNITPPVPVIMSGYDARKTPFTGVHDELFATALYFIDATNKAMIITADLIGFPSAYVDEIKKGISIKTGIPPESIMITAVHNHGGPAVGTYEDNLPASNKDYIILLKDKLITLAAEAVKNPVPFKMGKGKGSCNMNINRRAEFADGGIWLGRNPAGPCDHQLDVIEFKDLNDRTLAVLINWPCHGTTSGQDNYQITGDWPGAAARYLHKQMGNDVIVGVTAGASADINPIYGPGTDFSEIEAVGYHVGKEAWAVMSKIKTVAVKSLKTIYTTMTFPGKKTCKDQFPQTSYETAPDVEIRLTAFKIGDLVLCGISGELMTEIGMEVKSLSPAPETTIITHCNGSSGYICTDKAFKEGGYEVKVTGLMPGAEKPLLNKMLEMIHAL